MPACLSAGSTSGCSPTTWPTWRKSTTTQGRRDYIRHAIELIGCLYLRISDHMPLSPDIGNILFGTSPPNQAITLGGITPEGEDGVNDMTYIFLKVTEMLGLPDPNINARINPEKNSSTYIRRLCEVNYTTSATPSLHNDEAVFASLRAHGYPEEHIHDWSATGCVEPTISGRHNGNTGAMLINLVAALEMALHNGRHPLMQWDLGPKTGEVEDFASFEDFFAAYTAQLRFLIEQAVCLNNLFAQVHAEMRPTPFISATMEGCIEKGRDITRGGARYNTTGTANIGLVDVVDSLMAIKKLVFDEQKALLQGAHGRGGHRLQGSALRAFPGAEQGAALRFGQPGGPGHGEPRGRLRPRHLASHRNYRGRQVHQRVLVHVPAHRLRQPLRAPPLGRLAGSPSRRASPPSRTPAGAISTSSRTWPGSTRRTWTTTWPSTSSSRLRPGTAARRPWIPWLAT